MSEKKAFLITIDTEGDNLWERPRNITTNNARFITRFQMLCEKYSLRPSYLVNYEMAKDSFFIEFGRDIIKRNAGEIGMHLHAWNTPPCVPLTEDDFFYHPYLIEYSKQLMDDKISFLTKLLEDTFGEKMSSHRAGRWSFNNIYAQLLCEKGYHVDCSVTPYVSWKKHIGDPAKQGGTNYTLFCDKEYFLDLNDIQKEGDSKLLEIPMTIIRNNRLIVDRLKSITCFMPFSERIWNRIFPEICWLQPNNRNLHRMLNIIDRVRKGDKSYLEFMLHSSEFMPDGSPTFTNKKHIEKLYYDIEYIFDYAHNDFAGKTLNEYYVEKCKNNTKCVD